MTDADLATDFASEPIVSSRQDHSGRMALPAASHSRDLTDEQWVLIGPFLPKLARRTDGRGRPWLENRAVLNGILWILRTGAPWADLPVSPLLNAPPAVSAVGAREWTTST